MLKSLNKKGGEVADLVAVRINGRMAEWTDTAYNFTYEGDSSIRRRNGL